MRIVLLAISLAAAAAPALAAGQADPRCASFGEGFIYAEGIASCVRVGGLVRMDAGFGHGGGSGGRGASRLFGSTAQVGIEVDKDTEAGPFRAVVEPRGVLQNELH